MATDLCARDLIDFRVCAGLDKGGARDLSPGGSPVRSWYREHLCRAGLRWAARSAGPAPDARPAVPCRCGAVWKLDRWSPSLTDLLYYRTHRADRCELSTPHRSARLHHAGWPYVLHMAWSCAERR